MKEETKICQCKDCLEKSIPVFTLSEKELELFCKNSIAIAFQKGEKIIKQGTFTQNIVFIKSGIIMIHQTGPLNRDEILKIDKGPKFVGIPDVYANKIHSYSVTALTDTNTCFIDFAGFQYLIQNNGHFATEILKTMSANICSHYKRCVSKIQKQLTAIFAEALLYFADYIFENDEFEIPLTRTQCGQFIGTTRETVTKIVHDLTIDNIIEANGKKIRIMNKHLLQKISNAG